MRREPYNGLALLALTQNTRCTSYVVAVGRGANRDSATGGRPQCLGCCAVNVSRKNRHNWRNAERCQFISVRRGIGRQVDGKSVTVRRGNGIPVDDVPTRHGLVGVSESALATIRVNQVSQGEYVDVVTVTGQVARLVMPPQLTLRKRGDFGQECVKGRAALTFGYGFPMHPERSATRIAAVAFERAYVRACVIGRGANRDWSGFLVATLESYVKVHGGFPLCVWLVEQHYTPKEKPVKRYLRVAHK